MTRSPPLSTPPPSRTARTSPSRSAPRPPSTLPIPPTLLDTLLVLLVLLLPLLLLLLSVLLVWLEECRLLAMQLDSTITLASVRLMLSLRPMLSTELDTPLPLLLLLEVTPLPPTAMPRPGGCATPGQLRPPVRSPTLSVCLSPSAPACPSAPPSPSLSVTLPPGPSATPSPGRCPGLSAEPGPPPSATPSPTLLLTKCATPAQFRSAMPSPSRSPSRSLLRSAPRSPA